MRSHLVLEGTIVQVIMVVAIISMGFLSAIPDDLTVQCARQTHGAVHVGWGINQGINIALRWYCYFLF